MKLIHGIAAFCLLCAPCKALHWDASLGVDAGFRYDDLSADISIYNSSGTVILMDQLAIGNVHILELGLDGRVALERNWFLQGKADLGTVVNGTYFETVVDFSSVHTKAQVKDGYSKDFSVSLGYFFDFTNKLRIGPLGGWSYNFLHLEINKARERGMPNPLLDGLSYNNRWRGPWTGFVGEYSMGHMLLTAGYEYHWAGWKAEWILNGPDQAGGPFSEERTCKNAFGQVVFGKIFFSLNNGWDFNASINYQRWKAKNGEAKPLGGSFAGAGLPTAVSGKVTKATWKPLQIRVGCNYRF